ncbi:glutamate dehydrogenase, putative [Plasmodium malariae]|uniref:Glutamate dehydrogenase, putative n=1 Tax=Plasmodium malariae TaxID=5858 RepID=A0A1A8X2F0_PLAMA|nr:glutamate dehydrogenase, putative [Plasmodium malariae]SBS99416.1 glutamate dehydrogenase, putative (GDH3) [Plasmodium malariae]SBT87004.1 glutamate dehydrogenase, putative [Plasmodium malariae]
MDVENTSPLNLTMSSTDHQCFESEPFSNNSITWKDKYAETKELLRSYNLFSDHLINYSIDFYFNKLGFNRFHFEETSPELISKVVVCIITAKINEQYSSDKYFPIFEEKHDNFIFIITRVFADDNKTRLNYKMEKKIEEKYFNFSDMSKHCYRLKSFRSVHSLFDKEHTYQEPLRTYILELPTYNDDIISENETDLKKLTDVNFYNYIKGTKCEEIYYELNKAVLYDLTGQFIQTNYYITSETTFSLTIAVKRSNVISSIFSLIGDCLNMHRCFSYSKYVEPLKNGVLLIILNVNVITNTEQERKNLLLERRIQKILKSLKTLCLFNDSKFIQLSVKRIFTAEESAYIFIIIKFIAFFSTNSFSSYKKVENALHMRNDNSSSSNSILNDFYIIKEKLKSSKYTKEEILNCALSNVKTIKLLFANFERKLNKKYSKEEQQQEQKKKKKAQPHDDDTSASSQYEHIKDSKYIIDEIEDNHHKNILQYFYMFEKYAVKTNFFVMHKISFAVSFDGALLKDSIYDSHPYSIVMILGLHFVGFHIRFSKISRGGIRIVISNNMNSYMHNYNNLFDEAYNLAYTQNFKNKDIPEGGSKGIILLDADVCNNANTKYIKNLCFYSYVNSILDLLINEEPEKVLSVSVGSSNEKNFNNTTTLENASVDAGQERLLTPMPHVKRLHAMNRSAMDNGTVGSGVISSRVQNNELNDNDNRSDNRSNSKSRADSCHVNRNNNNIMNGSRSRSSSSTIRSGSSSRNNNNSNSNIVIDDGVVGNHRVEHNTGDRQKSSRYYSYINGTTEDAVQKIMSSKLNKRSGSKSGDRIVVALSGNGRKKCNGKEGEKNKEAEKKGEEVVDASEVDETVEEEDEDLIFLGPDENTGSDQLMDWACIIAKKRNYSYWKTFSTGKLRKNGGVPHDLYGMTTLGIETYIKKLCEKLNIKEENIARSVVGGPDGDLGSNAILQSKTKIISIIDGSGVLYDKEGLNKEELIRLAKMRNGEQEKKKKIINKKNKVQNGSLSGSQRGVVEQTSTVPQNNKRVNTCCILYDDKYLSKNGFKIGIEDHNVEIFGKIIKSGLDFRNTFFLNPLNACDIFNPCGGRPHSINVFNVNNIIINGECIYKYIVEGANVFISDDARNILESKNVILFKDASTNKGGVISSSLEVLAGLVLNDKQYIQLMCSPDSDITLVEENEFIFMNLNQKKNHSLSFTRSMILNDDDLEIDTSAAAAADDNDDGKEGYKEQHDVNNTVTLDNEEHKAAVRGQNPQEGGENVSHFYKEYVKEIQKKIRHYCELEFESLWSETRRTKTPISQATNILSKKISELKKDILSSDTLCTDYKLMKKVLRDVIPPTLLKIVTFDQIFERVPYIYLRSLFASALASNYYYSQQFLNDLSVFNFFEYIRKMQSQCEN